MTLNRYSDRSQGRICDLVGVCYVDRVPGLLQGLVATLKGRCGGLFGNVKLTFCLIKRNSCRRAKAPPKPEGTTAPTLIHT